MDMLKSINKTYFIYFCPVFSILLYQTIPLFTTCIIQGKRQVISNALNRVLCCFNASALWDV